MSERLFRFTIAELQKIRIVCEKCNTATEATVKHLGGMYVHQCQFCKNDMQASNTLNALASNIEHLQNTTGFRVEFVIPDTSDTEKK
jgi:hypothetical protein